MPVRIKDYTKSKTKAKLELAKDTTMSMEEWKQIVSGTILSGRTGTEDEGKVYRAIRSNPINTVSDDSVSESEIAEVLLIDITGGIEQAWNQYSTIITNFSGTTTNNGSPHRPFVGYFHGRTECLNYFDSIRTSSIGPIIDRLYERHPDLQSQVGPI